MATSQKNDKLVWVHGIGGHAPGYSIAWRDAFNPYLNFPDGAFIEALWSTVFSAPTLFSATLDTPEIVQPSLPLSPTELAEANTLLKSLTTTIQARQSAQASTFTGEWDQAASRAGGLATNVATLAGGTAANAGGALGNVGGIMGQMGKGGSPSKSAMPSLDVTKMVLLPQDTVGEFVEYLVSRRIRTAVKEKLKAQLRQIADGGTINTIIAHSWGTVVAYESLIDLELELPQFHLKHLITLGSPLWMVHQLLDERSGRKPANTDTWINIQAQGDPIGSWLKPGFQVDKDYMVSNYGNTVNPHSSYFLPKNIEVQQNIVAALLLAS
ncbi:hypothetical protein EPA93_07545 [Ktedonosporobacter rubrisoli]|uniref:Alpha/beta hydrolase n=1 Tax=Ktedonosporobacter rubrisoli TaxID=2509675 RepID=A0A4P6JL07_KTERU|nr:hypothetical protein [Ktedonosporobacter rubrisoli]QBD75869.1 hypothetical protein EPA93_07545 [Ktedonosporobacter rubrisoli]